MSPPNDVLMEEEEQELEQEDLEGRAYWAQFYVRANTCHIFADNGSKLDDVDISCLSQKMVQRRDYNFSDINDEEQLAKSNQISVDRIG